MTAPRRESSADSAARYLAARTRRLTTKPYRRHRAIEHALGPAGAMIASAKTSPRRIVVDFAEPTLQLIHEVLCDRIEQGDYIRDKLSLLLIAEQMVAVSLGIPACDEPPLTDRRIAQ